MQSTLLIRRLSFLLLLPFLIACSPEKKVQRYSYLFEQGKNNPRPASSPASPEVMPTAERPPAQPARPNPVEIEDNHTAATAHSGELSNRQVDRVIKTAQSYLGTRYQYGGTSRRGIDCSGLVCTAYGAINRELPRASSQMARSGRDVQRKKIEPGDLVFFSAKNGNSIDHVGLVTDVQRGEVSFIHSTTSAGVRIDRLDDDYWAKRFRKAVRP